MLVSGRVAPTKIDKIGDSSSFLTTHHHLRKEFGLDFNPSGSAEKSKEVTDWNLVPNRLRSILCGNFCWGFVVWFSSNKSCCVISVIIKMTHFRDHVWVDNIMTPGVFNVLYVFCEAWHFSESPCHIVLFGSWVWKIFDLVRLLREHLMKEPDAEEQEVWLSGIFFELLDESRRFVRSHLDTHSVYTWNPQGHLFLVEQDISFRRIELQKSWKIRNRLENSKDFSENLSIYTPRKCECALFGGCLHPPKKRGTNLNSYITCAHFETCSHQKSRRRTNWSNCKTIYHFANGKAQFIHTPLLLDFGNFVWLPWMWWAEWQLVTLGELCRCIFLRSLVIFWVWFCWFRRPPDPAMTGI